MNVNFTGRTERILYKNSEGYADPTAGAALAKIRREEKLKNKHRFMPKVYICSPFAGDTEKNTEKARGYCAFAVRQGFIPFAAHLFFPQFLSDSDPKQRELGIFMGIVYLTACKECWVFGSHISDGMKKEIDKAKQMDKTVRYFTEEMEEVTYEGDALHR